MARKYEIVEGTGWGTFLRPPGHPDLHHKLIKPRSRSESVYNLDYALTDEANADPVLREEVRRIIDSAVLVESEAWVRSVYGYFKNMYAPESGDRNVSNAVSDPTNSLPPERHLAVLCVREYFPDHKPRTDLISDPGKGYGAWPCDKCGERVQYEARFDAYAIVRRRIDGSGMTIWKFLTECGKGGKHAVDGIS